MTYVLELHVPAALITYGLLFRKQNGRLLSQSPAPFSTLVIPVGRR